MKKKDIEEFIKSKNIRIQNCDYKDNIDYLTSEYPTIILTE